MQEEKLAVAVIISANAEWRVVRGLFPEANIQNSPYGEWFVANLPGSARTQAVLFFHGGWGKVAAAGSAQYVIDRWSPGLLVNLGTCGGFQGKVGRGAIILAEKTVIYDIIEQMGDAGQAIADYTTEIDLAWLKPPYPLPVIRTLLVSADRDLVIEEIPELEARYGAIAGDWESGAIAYVAARNHTRTLILRGVTDLVGSQGGDAYGNFDFFEQATAEIMTNLVQSLEGWLIITEWEANLSD